MRTVRCFLAPVGAALAVALGLTFCEPAVAAPLQPAEAACKTYVLSKLTLSSTVADAVGLIGLISDPAIANPCNPDLATVPVTQDELEALTAEITRRWAAYQCDALQSLSVCLGLAAAQSKLQALPTVSGPAAAAGQLRWAADYHWNAVFAAFGTGPNGVSVLKLVLVGSGLPAGIAANVTPSTDYTAYAPPAAACDAMCERATAEVLALYPVFAEIDWFFQKSVVAPAYQQEAKEAHLARAKWDAYLFGGGDARVQLPWELLVNSAIYKARSADVAPGVYPTPPNIAVVLLHPSVGLTLKTSKGADSNVVGVVELIGLSHWRYDETDGSRKNEWGVSAVSVYQPRDNGRDWGFGGLIRTPWKGLNVVWARTKLDSGHDDRFLFSIDPSALLPGLGKEATCLFGIGDCK